jgi:hypothetical protein
MMGTRLSIQTLTKKDASMKGKIKINGKFLIGKASEIRMSNKIG